MELVVNAAQLGHVRPVKPQKENDQNAEDQATDHVELHWKVVRTIATQLDADECMQKLLLVALG